MTTIKRTLAYIDTVARSLATAVTTAPYPSISTVAGSPPVVIPGVNDYLRPDGTSTYLRPDGTSVYKRPF